MGSLGMVLAGSHPNAWDSHDGLGHSEPLWNAWGSLKPPLRYGPDSVSCCLSLQGGGGSLLSCPLDLGEGGIQRSLGLLQGDERGSRWHLRDELGTR